MKKLLFFIVIILLLCVNVFAQQSSNSGKMKTIRTIENGLVTYKKIPFNNSGVKNQNINPSNQNNDAPNGINAGPYLASEGFEDPFFPPTGWELFSFDTYWEQETFNANTGSNSAVIYGDIFIESWLITPEIDLTTASGPFINYYEYVEIDQGLEGEHNVLISTDYDGSGNVESFTWSQIRTGIADIFSWNLRSVDLSSYIGQTVYIAFQYIGVQQDVGDLGTTWYIDDVLVDDLCTGSEPIPNCATINSPPDGSSSLHTFVSFFWNPPVADATKQFFYVGTDGGGLTTPTNVYNGLEYNEITNGVGPVQLLPNKTYYWQIIPANCSQTAQNCPIWSFTTNDGEVNYGGGGTTQGGYYFANSTAGASGAPSQPTYSWIDISGTGTDLISSIGNDGVAGPFPLGFTFSFFGNNYTDFYISANGFISFSSIGGFTAFPYAIPSSSSADNVVAGYWKDLDPTNTSVTGQHLYYGSNGGDMVITFENYPEAGGDANGWITFQIIIKQSGNVKIQYNNSGSSFDINSGTVGIENSDGTKGILYRHRQYGGAIFGSPLALEFSTNSSALPVELTSFSASVNDGIVTLNWATATEVNNYGFEIERKAILNPPDGGKNIQWERIGFVEGHGNSNSPKQYSYSDNTAVSGKYYYRLKQLDNDGTFEYSDAVEVDLGGPTEFSLSQNYPNPFNPSTKIKFEIPAQARNDNMLVTLKIYDVLGNEVATLVNGEKPAGTYEVDFNASQLTSGVYFYKLQAGAFVQTKKMILLR